MQSALFNVHWQKVLDGFFMDAKTKKRNEGTLFGPFFMCMFICTSFLFSRMFGFVFFLLGDLLHFSIRFVFHFANLYKT